MLGLLKDVRALQNVGLALLGLAGVLAVAVVAVQVFLQGYPLLCGDKWFPQDQCEEVVVNVDSKVVETFTWDQRRKGLVEDKRIAHSDRVDFCFLTRITGKFEGGGEVTSVRQKICN